MSALEDDACADVVPAVMGHRVDRLVAAWRASFRGTCAHADATQFALLGDRRSACWDCASASAATTRWAGSGPCSGCGRYLEAAPSRVWHVPSHEEHVFVLVKLCANCSEELKAPPRRNGDTDDQDH